MHVTGSESSLVIGWLVLELRSHHHKIFEGEEADNGSYWEITSMGENVLKHIIPFFKIKDQEIDGPMEIISCIRLTCLFICRVSIREIVSGVVSPWQTFQQRVRNFVTKRFKVMKLSKATYPNSINANYLVKWQFQQCPIDFSKSNEGCCEWAHKLASNWLWWSLSLK